MKDGEVEEDQGGHGLVLLLFYAHPLAPFPLPLPCRPDLHQNRPARTSRTDKTRQLHQNLRHIGIIRTSVGSFKCPQMPDLRIAFPPSPLRQKVLRASCHFHAWPSGSNKGQPASQIRGRISGCLDTAPHAHSWTQNLSSTCAEFFILRAN